MGSKKRLRTSRKDAVLMATRVVASALPFGGPVATILSSFKPGYAKQLIKDVQQMDERLLHLEKTIDGFDAKTLEDDDSFKAKVAYWVQIAIRTHDEEKREILRNAVVNTATKNPPEEDLRSIFFKWVDDLEPWHLRLLKFFDNPRAWAKKNERVLPITRYMGSVSKMLDIVFSELKGRTNLYLKELIDKGLIVNRSYDTLQDTENMLKSSTTPIGKQFLSFIASADDESQSDNKTGNAVKEEASKS